MGSPTIAALFAQRVVVGVGEMGVSNNPVFTLSTYALGSCVGVAVYDPVAKAGGLLHVMLPDSKISAAKAAAQPAMFADTGLPLLVRALIGVRVDLSRVRIMLAGGASVICSSDAFKIGERNIKATTEWLTKQGYYARHSSVGGTASRTLHLDIGSGIVTLKTPTESATFSLVH